MISLSRNLTTILFTLCLAFIMYGCSDDSSTDVDLSEAPEVPEAVPVEVENSIFTNNNVTGEEHEAFNEAGVIAESAGGMMMGYASLGQSFFMFTDNQEPVFNDGVWEWSFTFSEGSEEFQVISTAEEVSNGYQWTVRMTGNYEGETVTDFPFISGFYSNDGQSGNWQYFSPEDPNQPVLEYTWDNDDQNNGSFSTIITDLDTGMETTIEYIREGNENTLVFDGFDTSLDGIVFWDLDSGTGYIEREGERRCWDESFAETSCS